MKVLEKLELLDLIGRELQSRMTFSDIETYLSAHGVDCKDFVPSSHSKWVYVKELLADVPEELVLTIANELGIEHSYSVQPKQASFWKPGYFKLFLSHLSSYKEKAVLLQEELKKYGISSFVAHEDIEPTKEWQDELEAGLHTMDALAALLMPGFKESNWCDQEVGFAVARDVLIIPVRKQLDPYGFIAKYQGVRTKDKNVADVAKDLFNILINSPKTREKMLRCLATAIAQSTDLSDALLKIKILKVIKNIPVSILDQLKNAILENKFLLENEKLILELNEVLEAYGLLKLGRETSSEVELLDDIPF